MPTLEQVIEDEWEPMTPLQLLTILAMANLAAKDASILDAFEPAEFFGMEDSVRMMKDNRLSALIAIMKRECGIEWSGKTSLFEFIIEEQKSRSISDKAFAVWSVDQRRREDAMKVLRYDRVIPGVLSKDVLDKAREVLAIIAAPLKLTEAIVVDEKPEE